MLGTLIKYEFLRTRKWLGIVLGVATLMTVLGALLARAGWPVISGLGAALSVLAVGGFLAVVQLALGYDFWRSSYTKTGYFTQSLPVRGSTIFWAKLLWGCVVSLVALAWTAVLGLIAFFGTARLVGSTDPLQSLRQLWSSFLAFAPTWVLLLGIVAVVLSFWSTLVQYYFSASIGSEARVNRLGLGGPVFVWIGLYLVLQALLLVGIVAIPFALTFGADAEVGIVSMNFFDVMVKNQPAAAMPLGFVPVLVLSTVVLIWRTVVSWDRKVSLV